MSKNLIQDLIKTDKKKYELSNEIKLIEQKTLDDTMKIIKSFILWKSINQNFGTKISFDFSYLTAYFLFYIF